MKPCREPTSLEALELFECPESQYDALLADKVERTKSVIYEAMGETLDAVHIFPSPPTHFRQRANFRVVMEHGRLQYLMFSATETRVPLRIERFPRGSLRLNELMAACQRGIQSNAVLGDALHEIRFQTTKSDSGGCMVLFCYTRALLESEWRPAAEALRATFLGPDCVLIGRSKRIKIVVGAERPCIIETFHVQGRDLQYEQLEGEFSQPNADICERMLTWSVNVTAGCAHVDLLELYCGNANFTVAMAPNFRKVLATEMSKTNVLCARGNVARNGVSDKVKVARLTAAEMSVALSPTGRDFNRLRQVQVELTDYNLHTIFVDPPRAGLDKPTLDLARTFAKIVYVSCNPTSLTRDLMVLRTTHTLTELAIFDQFAYTDHVECGAVLCQRSTPLDELPPPLLPEPQQSKKQKAKSEKTKLRKSASGDGPEGNKTKKRRNAGNGASPARRKRRRLGCCVM